MVSSSRWAPPRRVLVLGRTEPSPPAPSRVAIRRSAAHVKSSAGASATRGGKRAEKLLELEATQVQNHRTDPRRAAPPPLLALLSSPPAGVEPEAKASMHHDPNPFDEGSADDNPFSVSPKPFPPHSKILLPT